MVILIAGKSATGKDTASSMVQTLFGAEPIISHTTRPIREGEQDGINYHFIDELSFIDKINLGEMLEYREYNTLLNGEAQSWLYGISKSEVQSDGLKVGVTTLDAIQPMKELLGEDNVKVIYLYADDDIRKERAMKRGSFCEEEWNRRLIADDKDFEERDIIKVSDFYVRNEECEEVLINDICYICNEVLEESYGK